VDWNVVIATAITAIFAFAGVYYSNRKSAAIQEYRLEQLEKKVDTHNRFGDRIVLLEQFEVLQEERNKQFDAEIEELKGQVQ